MRKDIFRKDSRIVPANVNDALDVVNSFFIVRFLSTVNALFTTEGSLLVAHFLSIPRIFPTLIIYADLSSKVNENSVKFARVGNRN
jgi:ACR3 family arsenite efflux pump ArsB